MSKKEFILTNDSVYTVKQQYDRIRILYPQVTISFDKPTEDIGVNSWVYISGPTDEICERAKQYIKALTTPDARFLMRTTEDFKNLLLKNNREILISIESKNPAVINIDSETGQIEFLGEELHAVLAKSLIDEQFESFKKSQSNNIDKDIDILTNGLNSIVIDDSVKAFALKLGYDGDDISAAAKCCTSNGLDVNEDTLLEELMKRKQPKLDILQEEDKFVHNVAKTVAECTSEQFTSDNSDSLRGIVIDGSNVAMCHGHKVVFSCIGIEIVINWFKRRGHKNIIAFVPQWRQEAPKPDSPIINQEILSKLEKAKNLVYTPSRRINGRRVVCYDDRYIIKYAVESDSVIVSNDHFRDLEKENPKWKPFLDQHLLMYSFVNDMFMPPDDPLGRSGPSLDEFLRKGTYKTRPCPYRNKCTYGNKCRFYHPENNSSNSQIYNNADNIDNTQQRNYSIQSDPYSNTYTQSLSNNRTSQQLPMSCAAEMKTYEQQRSYQFHDQDVLARGGNGNNIGGQQSISLSNNRTSQQLPMSCAAEMNAYEQQRSYQFHDQDVLARGGNGNSIGGQSSADPNINIPEWQNQHPQIYPSMNYYQSQYALPQQRYQQQQQQQHQQHQQQPYYVSSNPNQMNQHWNNQSYPSQQSYTSPNTHSNNQYMVPMLPNRGQNSNSYSQMGMMPSGYMDPRTVNHQQYYKPTTMSHTLQSIETQQKIQETRRCPASVDTNSYMFIKLSELFPTSANTIRKVLIENPNERDINILAQKVLQVLEQ